ncbi:hypothetical protein AMAG_10612 [Allomyces macrogynus ATCC 38327]|uniref:Uncharacterized protein n=1 Tax=Allomyces macrogynus (strain ATCC 38327) TaxID=578462 RepID=A0A0L0SR08_ALLM3|nr:hypothetical protein AMAG_10612 [Allomyces macrogynus ATCC 38327]|eukprot:KNE64947.1 hypothetical protein AMAG_10612 [Allomyces macrogynus ATCC 38327]
MSSHSRTGTPALTLDQILPPVAGGAPSAPGSPTLAKPTSPTLSPPAAARPRKASRGFGPGAPRDRSRGRTTSPGPGALSTRQVGAGGAGWELRLQQAPPRTRDGTRTGGEDAESGTVADVGDGEPTDDVTPLDDSTHRVRFPTTDTDDHPSTSTLAAQPISTLTAPKINTVVPILVDRASAARADLRALQAEAESALADLERTETARRQAEAARAAAERDAEAVTRKIEATKRKKAELEDVLERLRLENDELEAQLERAGVFIKKHVEKRGGGAEGVSAPGSRAPSRHGPPVGAAE